MRVPSDRGTVAALRRPGRLLLVVLGLVAGIAAASAREVTVTGSRMKGFGRILLEFDAVTKVQVKVANSVLVIGFADPARIKSETLATEIAPYVAVVRRDPDNSGLRLALQVPYRVNVLEAGEKVFVDLLPQNWTGLPPALPPEVVAELAERARRAEGRLRASTAIAAGVPPRAIRLQTAELPTLSRFSFGLPAGLVPTSKPLEDGIELTFPGPAVLDDTGARPKLAPGIAAFDTAAGEGGALVVTIHTVAPYEARAFPEGETLVVDLQKPAAAPNPRTPAAIAAAAPAMVAKPAPAPAAPSPPPRAPAPAPPSADGGPQAEAPRAPAPPPVDAAARVRPPGTVVPVLGQEGGRPTLLFPFAGSTPAAAFERGGTLTLVFDTRDRLKEPAGDPGPFRPVELRSEEGLAIIRFDSARLGPVALAAVGTGWRLVPEGAALPPDALKVSRSLDESGHGQIGVSLAGASKSVWIGDRDGSRLAVVTAAGRVQNLPLSRSFVDFDLPATLHGVVVEARADDILVGPANGGVTIGRAGGLTITPPGRGETPGAAPTLVLGRDPVLADGLATVLPRYQELIAEAATAPRSGQAEARFRLARFLVAIGFNAEASSVLALASGDDNVFRQRRETSLLSAIAAIRAGRIAEGRRFLGPAASGDEPEFVLWRAVADASDRRWVPALAGFRRSAEVLERYPDEVVGSVRLLALDAALGVGDAPRAEGELAAIDRLATGSVPRDEHDLARAKVDEVAGRVEPALRGYEAVAGGGGTRAAAEARLRLVSLGSRRGSMPRAEAIDRLETLSVAWRGGPIEIATIDELARLYGEAGRWRDMFSMSRRANRFFPDHEVTRSLHERSAQMLENLILGPQAEALDSISALSLYFDFKELAPVGRRGDEIVRRLADRLVELDLLDQAGDLLQYQVDRRLSGIAKATVAARLAAIRLMSGKPRQALTVLVGSRLADLPDDVRRIRFMLEARAQSDLSRTDLALESIEGEQGPDFDRLRTSILWSARRWREAGESGERMLGTRWDGPDPLTDRERADVLRAGIAYAAGDERIALDRLRDKFGRKMKDSPDAQSFSLLLRPGAPATREFRALAQEATKADGLRQLLADLKDRRDGEDGKPPPLLPPETRAARPEAPARG